MAQTRQIAYKVRLGDIEKGNIIFDGERFSSLEVGNKKVSRINVISNVVDKYSNPEKNYNALTVDDGTGQIRVKGFSDSSVLLSGLEIGDTIKIIGWLRHFNNEIYIAPEIAVRVDPRWGYVRRLELTKEYGEFKEEAESAEHSEQTEHAEPLEEEKIEREKIEDEIAESAKSVILKKIRENNEGINVEQLIMSLKISVDEINDSISALISEGEIYEPKPGHLRSLD